MAHIHDKIDFTVEVFVVHKNKVLLRKHDKYGIWLSVGGHIELDEDPNQAAVREVKEEVGLNIELVDTREYEVVGDKIKQLIPPIALNRHHISDKHEHVTLIYVARSLTNIVVPEKETDKWVWCADSEIDALYGITEEVCFFAKKSIALTSRIEHGKFH